MAYPSLEQYLEALHSPQLVLTDPVLKSGVVAKNNFGMPLALCGGFALTFTFTCGRNKYAVRCFHKESISLVARYAAISEKLKSLGSKYFLSFEFQPTGIRVSRQLFPVVRMEWGAGETLGSFLDKNHGNKAAIQSLRQSLRALSRFLLDVGIAHGDLQPGNVMVSGNGATLQLIDYDGMYVEKLQSLGSAELGHRNFQHPHRTSKYFDAHLDRFSLISLYLALSALEGNPGLWATTRSDGDAIVFKANDFADPESSQTFWAFVSIPGLANDARNFAAICKGRFERIPSLEDFIAGKNIPQEVFTITTKPIEKTYLSAFPVLDATSYVMCLARVGEKVELIGRIVEVKHDTARGGKPYVFVNFGPWQGEIVKINIWSEGLARLESNAPNSSWIGRWISVIGLMEPPYRSRKYRYSHLAITITEPNQMHAITEDEAKFRLSSLNGGAGKADSASRNAQIIEAITGKPTKRGIRAKGAVSSPASSNQAILNQIRSGASKAGGVTSQSGHRTQQPKSGGGIPWFWIIIGLIILFVMFGGKR